MRSILLAALLAFLATTAGAAVYYAGSFRSQPLVYACNDGVDNDGDGATDYSSDPGCASAFDPSELDLGVECDNGLDDDGDGLVDYKTSGGDPDCASRTDNQEAAAPPAAACNDGLDNDGDGATDHPADTGCTALTDTNELDLGTQCDDGIDNDGDGFIDYKLAGGDPQCSSSSDNTEAAVTSPACSDGIDNDGDTFTDFPADPGCRSATDAYEFGFNECDDNLDNDGDTFTDYPDDTDCLDPSDLSESTDTPVPLCNDGIDNDNDGLIDFPADPGCENALDEAETSDALVCDNDSDDDGDGLADFRLSGGDPGCGSATDTSETLGTQCDDGVDNDGDGLIDYKTSGGDPDCDNAADDSEAAPPPPTNLTAAFTPEYMHGSSSCVGPPCIIYLSAIATTDPTTEDHLRDLVYEWDCGDASMGTWSTTGKARRYPRGWITGCYYPDTVSAGVKTITLTVTNPASGEVDTATANITITDIGTYYGANAHCFSNDTDMTGCPTGATQHPNVSGAGSFTTALATTCNADGARVACLFKRGDTFSGNPPAFYSSSPTLPGMVGAFGSGADPVIDSLTAGFTERAGWSVSNLDMQMSAGQPFGNAGPNIDRWTIMDASATGFTGGCFSTATGDGQATRLNTLEALIEVDCIRDTGSTPVGTMILHRGNKFLGMGGTWNNGGGANSEFVYRTVGSSDSAWQHIYLTGAGTGSNRNAMQFRTWAQAQGGGLNTTPSGIGPPPEPSRRNIISDNIIDFNQYNAIKGCQNNVCTPPPEQANYSEGSGSPQEMSDYLFERNFFRSSQLVASVTLGAGVIGMQGTRVTIRNNVIDLQGITGGSTLPIAMHNYSYTNCFLCGNDAFTVQGNTVYYDENISTTLTFCQNNGTGSAAGTGHSCDNNLVWRPADSGDPLNWTSGSGWAASSTNYNATVSPFVGAIPDVRLSDSDDFKLGAASAARNRGTPRERLDRDFCGATRPNSTSHDAGAWEEGATCP